MRGPGRVISGGSACPFLPEAAQEPSEGRGKVSPASFYPGLVYPLLSLVREGASLGFGDTSPYVVRRAHSTHSGSQGEGRLSHSALITGVLVASVPVDHKGDEQQTCHPHDSGTGSRSPFGKDRLGLAPYELCVLPLPVLSLPEPTRSGLICETRSWSPLHPLL